VTAASKVTKRQTAQAASEFSPDNSNLTEVDDALRNTKAALGTNSAAASILQALSRRVQRRRPGVLTQ